MNTKIIKDIIWKDIPRWELLYEINNFGSVRNKHTGKILIGDINTAGYRRVTLYSGDIRERWFVHRLVATVFIDNPYRYKEVNHKDGNKLNNCVSNLEWCDRTQNEREAHRVGLKSYKPFKVIFKDGRVATYEFAIDLANEIGVSKRTVINYLQGRYKGYLNFGIVSIQYI